MLDYQIQPNTKRCVVTGRELQPGEKFYSALCDDGSKLIRQDYSAEAWQGIPKEAFSFWSGRVPQPQTRRRLIIDDDLLLDCFHRLEGQVEANGPDAAKLNFRYVLALLLMRRRRLKFDEVRQEGDQEILCLRCARKGTQYQVIHPSLTEEEMVAVQEDVFQVLGWE